MLKVVKLQVIWSCSEQIIFSLVDKMFQHISVGLSRLIDKLFTNLLNINITETRTEGIKGVQYPWALFLEPTVHFLKK